MQLPEAFLLLTLPNCSLSSRGLSESGTLGLECVTLPIPNGSSSSDREVYLVLRLNTTEIPIDPTRVIQCSDTPVARVYTFNPNDPNELALTVATGTGDSKHDFLSEDLDTFEGLLEQYVLDFRPSPSSSAPQTQIQAPTKDQASPTKNANDTADLRGHLVMINEDTGEVIGQVEDRFNIREDPGMYERGHEKDPIVIDVPDEGGLRESDVDAMQAFARIVPPDQQDWITKSATVVSHAISFTTNLLVTTIASASDYYISKSAPSPHHTSANVTTQSPGTVSPNLRAPSPISPPVPPRALVFFTSERTRRGLRSVHSVSGQAVKVSAKTVKTIDNMIRRAMGAKPKENRRDFGRSSSPIPPSTPNSPPSVPYTPRVVDKAGPVYGSGTSVLQPGEWNPDSKPPLPPRSPSNSTLGSPQSPSAQFPPTLPPRSLPSSPHPPSLPPRNFSLSPSLPPQYTSSPQQYMSPPQQYMSPPQQYMSPPQQYMSPPQQYTSPPQQYTSPQSSSPQINAVPPQPKLTTKNRILISADLVLSTIDNSARRILDNGTTNLGKVMHHKYGPEAAESTVLMAGTARNVGLVYVDMKGVGRRALLRKAGMGLVKGTFQNEQSSKRPVPPVPGK